MGGEAARMRGLFRWVVRREQTRSSDRKVSHPSSGPPGHLLPQGGKETAGPAKLKLADRDVRAIRSGCGGGFRDDLTFGHASLKGHFDLMEDRL